MRIEYVLSRGPGPLSGHLLAAGDQAPEIPIPTPGDHVILKQPEDPSLPPEMSPSAPVYEVLHRAWRQQMDKYRFVTTLVIYVTRVPSD